MSGEIPIQEPSGGDILDTRSNDDAGATIQHQSGTASPISGVVLPCKTGVEIYNKILALYSHNCGEFVYRRLR